MHEGDQFRWQDSAACDGLPSYLFFPEERKLPNFKEDPAYKGLTYKDFCGGCPVKWKCREFANLHEEKGNWGGISERERNKLTTEEDRDELREYKKGNGEYWPLYGHKN